MRSYYSRTDLTPAYRAAVVLYPTLKFKYFKEKQAENKAQIKDCKTIVKAYQVNYMQQRQITAIAKEQATASKSPPQPTTPKDPKEEKLSLFRRFLQLVGAKERKLKDKLERYYALKPNVEVYNPIKQQLNYREEYPNLYILALELHSCPKISFKYKQIFSNTNRIITSNYNHFSATLLEEEEYLKKQLKIGIPGT